MATRSGPQTPMTASVTSSIRRARFSTGPPVLIGPVVGAVLQELVEEIAIGAVEFHAIEAGSLGVLRTSTVGFDNAGNLAGFQDAWGDEWALRAQ